MKKMIQKTIPVLLDLLAFNIALCLRLTLPPVNIPTSPEVVFLTNPDWLLIVEELTADWSTIGLASALALKKIQKTIQKNNPKNDQKNDQK